MIRTKKGSGAISVAIIVFLTVLVLLSSLVSFRGKDMNFEKINYQTRVFEDLYSRQEIVDYEINNMVANSIDKNVVTKEKFFENFNKQLALLRNEDGSYKVKDLKQIEDKLIDENLDLVILNGELESANLTLDLGFLGEYKEEDKILFKAVYDYKKDFIART